MHLRTSVSTPRVSFGVFRSFQSRTNPYPATVPTLVVPLQKTLGPDMESRYKAIQDSKVLFSPCPLPALNLILLF